MTDGNPVATILCSVYDRSISALPDIHIKNMGYRTICVSDSTEAIPHVPRADLVISDINNGGYAVYVYVMGNRHGVNVILINEADKSVNMAAPKAAILRKPFTPQELEAIIKANLPEHLKPVKTR